MSSGIFIIIRSSVTGNVYIQDEYFLNKKLAIDFVKQLTDRDVKNWPNASIFELPYYDIRELKLYGVE